MINRIKKAYRMYLTGVWDSLENGPTAVPEPGFLAISCAWRKTPV
jgi:hypothetical protein